MGPTLNSYLNLLKKHSTPIQCPHCEEDSIPPERFESHCATEHDLDSNVRCVWCFGHTFWPERAKTHHVSHLIECFKHFIQSYTPNYTLYSSPNTPTLLDLEPMCQEKQFGQYFPIPTLPPSEIWPLAPKVHGLTFTSDSLNLAVACVQFYLQSKHQSDWYHMMFKPQAFHSFLLALDRNPGQTHTLPFSCFCAGGGGVHKHVIVVSQPKGHFTKVLWKNIKCPKKNTLFRKQAIESAMDLVNVLGYVSQLKSHCQFSFFNVATGLSEASPSCHYYVTRSLPPMYKLVLTLQWDGGLLELIHQEYATVNPLVLAPAAKLHSGMWRVRVRDLAGIVTRLVLPVHVRYAPCAHATPFSIHLTQGRKMYFAKTDTPAERWVEWQAEKGNAFYEAVGDDLYYPTLYQQKCLYMMQPQLLRITELELGKVTVETELDQLHGSVAQLKQSHVKLKRKVGASERELKALQRKHIHYLESEVDKLRLEIGTAKRMRGSRLSY